MASFLDSTLQSIGSVQSKISTAESRLSQIILDAQQELVALFNEKRVLEEQAQWALGEQAPIRKVPAEILREVFLQVFEDDRKGRAGWLFAAVCHRWRALALETPRLWTRMRLVTRLDDSADVVRLWLERSGPSMPLDIEIYLRVPQTKAAIPAECTSAVISPLSSRRPRRRVGTLSDDATYSAPIGNGSEAWGHVAVFYLKQQLPRWKRFIFRYDRVFSSLSAFKTIAGNAPNLQEFQISCIEPGLLNFHDWSWNSAGLSFPALQKVALTNTSASLSSSLLSQPLRSIYLCALAINPIQVSALMQTLAIHAPTLTTLSLHLPVMTPPVVPATALPYSATTPLCLPVLEELSLGGHYLLAQLLSAITTPSLEELNVDIDLGRGGIGHAIIINANGGGNYIEDILQEFLNRGSPAPADRLKALSIGFGFGNGRRATQERESDLYLQAAKSAQACVCGGTTFLPPNHPTTPSSFTPSVVHISWALLGNLPALESLKVGLGGHAGQAWTANGNTGLSAIPYQGGAADLQAFLNSLCTPDEDFMTGTASIGTGGPGGNGNIITFLGGPPPQNPGPINGGVTTVNFPPAQGPMNGNPPPFQTAFNFPAGIHHAMFGAGAGLPPLFPSNPPIPPPPGAANAGYIPPAPPNFVMGGGGGLGVFGNNPINTNNGWVLPNLVELGIKVGSAAFLPQTSNGPNGLMPLNPYAAYPPIMSYSSWSSSLDDPSHHPGAGHVRRLLDMIDGRNPKTGRGQNVEGVVPERLKRLELVLNVAGVPGRGNAHAASLSSSTTTKETGGTKGKGKKKANESESEEASLDYTNVTEMGNLQVQVQEIVKTISAAASGNLNTTGSQAKKDTSPTANRTSNPATARTMIGPDSMAWIEERVDEVDVRCECLLWEGPGTGLGRW